MIQPLKRGGGEGRWSRIHWKGEWDQLRESTIVHHRLTHNRCSTVRSLMQHSFASGHHSAAAGSECIPAAGLQATTDTSSHTTQQSNQNLDFSPTSSDTSIKDLPSMKFII